MSIRGCTFCAVPTHSTYSSTNNNLSSQLKRHGYRVRRDSLSGKASALGVRSGSRKTTPPPPPAVLTRGQLNVKKKDEKLKAFEFLEENFFGHRSSRQFRKNSKNKPTNYGSRSPPAGTCCKTKKRSLTTRKRSSPSLNFQHGTDSDTGIVRLSSSVEKEAEGWYHPKSTDIDDSSSISISSVADERCVCTEYKLRTNNHSCQKLLKRQHYYSLSSDRLRQHTAHLHANKMSAHTLSPPRNPLSSTQNEVNDEGKNETRHVKLRIVDARPYINAKGNALMGKGYEVVERLGESYSPSSCSEILFNFLFFHRRKSLYQP